MTIWEKYLEDGTRLWINYAYLPSIGYRSEREYRVCWNNRIYAQGWICMLRSDGSIKEWNPLVGGGIHLQQIISNALNDISETLIIDQVMSS
jgi:hypothetical protein